MKILFERSMHVFQKTHDGDMTFEIYTVARSQRQIKSKPTDSLPLEIVR